MGCTSSQSIATTDILHWRCSFPLKCSTNGELKCLNNSSFGWPTWCVAFACKDSDLSVYSWYDATLIEMDGRNKPTLVLFVSFQNQTLFHTYKYSQKLLQWLKKVCEKEIVIGKRTSFLISVTKRGHCRNF